MERIVATTHFPASAAMSGFACSLGASDSPRAAPLIADPAGSVDVWRGAVG